MPAMLETNRPWWSRLWLRFTDWPTWRAEECLRGYHSTVYDDDPAHPEDNGHYYVTHCRYCSYQYKWESWGE